MFSICGLQPIEWWGKAWSKRVGFSVWVGGEGDIQRTSEAQCFVPDWRQPSPVPPLVANFNPHLKKTMWSVLVLITEIILKRVRESIFFQSNNFIVCKVTDGTEVAKSLMLFKLPKIIVISSSLLNPFVKKINMLQIVLIMSFYYTTDVYPYQPPIEPLFTHICFYLQPFVRIVLTLSLFMIICVNLFFKSLWK